MIMLILALILSLSVSSYSADEKTKIPAVDRLAEHGVEEIVFAVRADSNDGHWYANIGYWSYDENKMLYGKGGRLCKLNVKTGKLNVLIEDLEGTIRDPVVHYDAKKILFSWRKADSRIFHLYECDIGGGNMKQLTDGNYDDIEPCYLPDGGIVFVSGRGKRWVQCWLSQVATLHRCDGDPTPEDLRRTGGKNIREISANVEQDNTPWVLHDGRIIYQRWEYVDRSQVNFHHLWTTNPDGTGQMVYFGNMHASEVYIDAKPLPGTDKVLFINSPGHGRIEHSGRVAIVSDRNGPDDKSMLRNISRSNNYRDPWPLSEDLFIVAIGRKIQIMNSKGETEDLYSLPQEFQGVNLQEPRPLITRKRERIIPPRVNLKKTTGQLILADAYFGRNMEGVKKGEIKKLLVLETLPKPVNFTGGMDPLSYGGTFTLERLVGTIPVEPDGSAFMELPANRAFFFVALDENNNSIKRMQSFLTVMPGEVTSCVGCHEERGTTPINSAVMGRLQALKRAPSKPEPIKGVPDVFDYPRDIQPILDKHCVKCHDYDKREGEVILTGDRGPMFSHSYITLTIRRQFSDGRNLAKGNYPPRALGTSASPIMKKLNGTHPPSLKLRGTGPKKEGLPKVKLSQHEQDMIRYWIESAAAYPGTYGSLGCGAIGGFQQNQKIHKDDGWPTAGPFRESVQKRCTACHKHIPRSLSDESGMSFWVIDSKDERHKRARHLAFNLTRPDKSLFLLAPLSKKAGGYGLCRKKRPAARGQKPEEEESNKEEADVFKNKSDPDYIGILAHITAGKDFLENELTRFDMKNFRPRRGYFREMKRYGILPEDFDVAKDNADVYELDRKYWKSLWYQPK